MKSTQLRRHVLEEAEVEEVPFVEVPEGGGGTASSGGEEEYLYMAAEVPPPTIMRCRESGDGGEGEATGGHSRTLWVPRGRSRKSAILECAARYLNRLYFAPHYVQSTRLGEAVFFGQKSGF